MEGIHEVRAGQTLFGIAKQYGMELETLRRLNNLRSNNILVGQQLRVMKPSSVATKTATPTPASVAQAQPAATSQEKFYTAQAGDTLYGIARRNGITVATLLEMNNKKQATLLVGEKLRVRW
jgi:LysM repeat protein